MPDQPSLRLRCLAATFHLIASVPIRLLAIFSSYASPAMNCPDLLPISSIPDSIITKDTTAISIIIISLGIIAYFVNTVVAGIFALGGNRWINSLIFPIIPTAR